MDDVVRIADVAGHVRPHNQYSGLFRASMTPGDGRFSVAVGDCAAISQPTASYTV